MNNIQKLITSKNESEKIFGSTIKSLSHSQGLYGRLIEAVNELDYESFIDLCSIIQNEKFSNSLDVVYFVEQVI